MWLLAALGGAAWGSLEVASVFDSPTSESRPESQTAETPGNLADPAEQSWQNAMILSTVAVAAFTAVLAVSTIGLWIVSYSTARRQLRAYVCITPQGLYLHPNQVCVVDCIVKNYGLTPAFDINHTFGMGIFPQPLPEDFSFPKANQTVRLSSSLFPSHEMFSWFHTYVPTEDEVIAIEAGRSRFYVWGITTYRDAFKRQQWTRFSGSVGGKDFADTQKAMREGNKEPPGFRWHWGAKHNQAS